MRNKLLKQKEFTINFYKHGYGFLTKTITRDQIVENNHKDRFKILDYETVTVNTKAECIEYKVDQEKKRVKKIIEFKFQDNEWIINSEEILESNLIEIITPKESFKYLGFYKLIETEDEFDNYMNSNFSCDIWCQIKVTKTMIDLGLGSGFISGFGDLIGTYLDRYKLMIELSKECDDRDLLMYMLIKKFGN